MFKTKHATAWYPSNITIVCFFCRDAWVKPIRMLCNKVASAGWAGCTHLLLGSSRVTQVLPSLPYNVFQNAHFPLLIGKM
jgi:hypothetical protein